MNHASLFSGIGGFDLAVEWMGWTNVFNCEINPFCRTILNHYWPHAISYEDIKKTDFTIHRGGVDILTGGFPCQPFSQAGKRQGTEDDRYLWPEMYRAIREIQPRWVVAENVRGLVNWSGGLVFDKVCFDLEAEGYEVLPFILPAAGVNAPHRRERVWIVANASHIQRSSQREKGQQRRQGRETLSDIERIVSQGLTPNTKKSNKQREGICKEQQGGAIRGQNPLFDRKGTSPNSNGNKRCKRRSNAPEQEKTERHVSALHSWQNWNTWQDFPTQSPVCGGDDGLPSELGGIALAKWRTETLKAYGNAIVPQLAYEIFKVIEQMENQ